MDKYERIGKRYAAKKNHVTFKGESGKILVYEPNGRSEWDDEPDRIFDGWNEYTRFYIGKDLRKKHLRNNKSYKRIKPF